MNAISLLTSRHSSKKLCPPVPTQAQVLQMLEAACHAPDHGRLQPYRFVAITPERMAAFGHVLHCAAEEMALGERGQQKAEKLSTQMPFYLVAIAHFHLGMEKVPEWEQLSAASAATYAVQLTATAQGFATVWITGKWVESNALRQALHCAENEKIIGLIAMGTPADPNARPAVRKQVPQDLLQQF